MRLAFLVLGTLALCPSACSSTGQDGGGGGTSGGSGAAGGSGMGGQRVLPVVCNGTVATDGVQVSLVGPNGMPVEVPVTASVTVASVEACAGTPCPSAVSPLASRIVLADADQQQWTLYLRNVAMPADIIEVGGTFDLVVATAVDPTFFRTVDQTIVLARAGEPIVFAASMQKFYSLSVPQLTAFGIEIADDGMLCDAGRAASGTCYFRPHAARVSVAGASAVIAAGEIQSVGSFSFNIGQFSVFADTGGCDAKSKTAIAGFRQ